MVATSKIVLPPIKGIGGNVGAEYGQRGRRAKGREGDRSKSPLNRVPKMLLPCLRRRNGVPAAEGQDGRRRAGVAVLRSTSLFLKTLTVRPVSFRLKLTVVLLKLISVRNNPSNHRFRLVKRLTVASLKSSAASLKLTAVRLSRSVPLSILAVKP